MGFAQIYCGCMNPLKIQMNVINKDVINADNKQGIKQPIATPIQVLDLKHKKKEKGMNDKNLN